MRPFLGSILTLALAGSALAQVDITTCGTTVPAHQVGTLQNDLVCTGIGVGVVLEHKATLQLNGHTIGGTFDWDGFSVENGCVVQALDAATIVGPGEITGTAVWAVVQSRGRRLDLANLTIRDSNVPGVGMGGSSKGDLRLRNVTILRVLDGIVGRNVTLEDVTIADAVVRGIASIGRVRGKNVTLTQLPTNYMYFKWVTMKAGSQ